MNNVMPQTGAMLNALVPDRCPTCHLRAAHANRGFCADCQPLLPWIIIGCEICGVELYEVGVCGSCQTRPPYYDHAVIPFQYRAPVSAQIQTLKYHRQLRHAGSLAAMLCRRVWQDPHPAPDVLIPVPLHPRRLRQRGYNQALEIARFVGRELGVEVSHRLLARIKDTMPQVGLGERERRRNVKGAFQTTTTDLPAHIALIDDVVTSGSTINVAARALKDAGVSIVSVWAAARS